MNSDNSSQVVLIAGPSGCGKSTIAAMLCERLRARSLSLDDYFIRRSPLYVETAQGRVRNYEHPSLYDGAMLAADITAHAVPVVAEGLCLLHYPEIQRIPALRIFLAAPFETCLRRRQQRRPARPSDRSFAVIGREQTELWVEPQRRLPGVIVVPCSESVEETWRDVLDVVLKRPFAAA